MAQSMVRMRSAARGLLPDNRLHEPTLGAKPVAGRAGAARIAAAPVGFIMLGADFGHHLGSGRSLLALERTHRQDDSPEGNAAPMSIIPYEDPSCPAFHRRNLVTGGREWSRAPAQSPSSRRAEATVSMARARRDKNS